MATATRSPLTEQAEKLQNLARHLSDGRLLEPVLRMAQTGDVWSGPVHDGFLNWMQFAVDGWVRNQVAQGVRLVAESLANRAAELERAAQATVASGGQIPMAPPAPPAPLNYSPGRPPPYGDIGGGASNNKFNKERMAELARLLESTADGAVIDFARNLRAALEPPPAPPPPPGAPPLISPLPPDAAVAAGDPGSSSPGANAYLALADELHKAADDIERRIRLLSVLDEPLPTATLDPNLVAGVGAGATAGAQSSGEAVAGSTMGPPAPTRTLEDIDKARHDGAATAAGAGKILADKNFNLKDEEKLRAVLEDADHHADDPAYALAFMDSFIPDGLAAWCRIASRNVINVDLQAPLLRPMSRVFATATRQGDQFPPEMRKALLNSPCLDTVVHDGTFEKDFALEAARKILKDPDRYERSDGSDRVYAGLDQKGNYESGDARVGALRLLANNPDAAQEILEKHGTEGRRLIFDALEDSGLAGKEAAAVLEAGLQHLDSKLSEDTLELIIKDTADGRLKLHDYGKQALARILSTEQALERLKVIAVAGRQSDRVTWLTGDEGFNVPLDTFQKCIGKVLDDKAAHAAFLGGIATYSADDLRDRVATLGKGQIVDPEDDVYEVKSGIRSMGKLLQGIADGVEDASGEKEKNAFLAAGLDLAVSQTVALVPGGFAGKFIVDKALETAGKESLDKVLDAKNQERIKNLDKDELKEELNRNGRNFVTIGMLSDKNVTDQLVDEDSRLRANWDKNKDGQLEIPDPDSNDWQKFTEDVTSEMDHGTPIGRALLELDVWAEAFKV
jgi:hypothetical protein